MKTKEISSGIPALDELLQGFRPGDNIVWQIDDLKDYSYFAQAFAEQGIRDGHDCVYLRFAPHPAILESQPSVTTIEIDAGPGFDFFSGKVHSIIEKRGKDVRYVFDNLSALVAEWATDELLANFFQVTCPYILELGAIAYFGLTRAQHGHAAVAKVRDTTQILIDVYHVDNAMYIHPLKAWDRYSSEMFLPHLVSETGWSPVFHSAEAAAVSSTAHRQPLSVTVSSIAPWESVYAKLIQYRETGENLLECTPEVMSLKHELSRMMISDHPSFSELADQYLTVDDLINIRNRLIGSGRIGGKAAGMLLARRMLLAEKSEIDFSRILEAHDSFYIGSDVFFTFLVNNHLFQLRLQITKDRELSREQFDEVEQRFLGGDFPPEIMEQFRDMLDYFGQAPIIVRSSSLLEDSLGNPFAGKYRSEFCANQGSPEERTQAFLRAVKLVYASTLNPDALSYRHRQGLSESDEQMAILVQRVSGIPYKNYFFPSLAGVSFSKNLYAWTSRIDAQKGMVRLVFGLGTRAVNRVGGDYTRMLAISHPQLRPEAGIEIAKYSQHNADVLDLQSNEFLTLPTAKILADCDYPNLHLIASLMSEGYTRDIIGICPRESAKHLILTFDNLIRRTSFTRIMDEMLARLEETYGHPIDTEFTAHINPKGDVTVNLLQCRSLPLPGTIGPVELPDNISRELTLFRCARFLSGGIVQNIRYILYIDPSKYAQIPSMEMKKSLGRVVGSINKHPSVAEDRLMMMGPGRWGSTNIDLGVNVGYSDIHNTSVLVEIAREEMGHVPEVSYGTHFFQDLVEAEIMYLPVYPSDPETQFNNEFFVNSRNILADLLPGMAEFSDVVHLIDVPSSARGLYAQIVADPHTSKAICFIGQER